MATLQRRGDKFYVVYDYKDDKGHRKQKWEGFHSKKEAAARKREIETLKDTKEFVSPTWKTMAEYLNEWLPVHARAFWSVKTCQTNMHLVKTHIIPHIGDIRIQDVEPLHIDKLYDTLRNTRCRGAKAQGKEEQDIPFLSETTVRLIHGILVSAFDKAVEWRLITRSPVICAAPSRKKIKNKIWTPQQVALALQNIDDPLVRLTVHTAFIDTLRNGETMGIKWSDINYDENSIHITKTLQRVDEESLRMVRPDEILFRFPRQQERSKSFLILKKPKTDESERIVFFTNFLKEDLLKRREQVILQKAALGSEYNDYDLVFALPNGNPIEPKLCEKWFVQWQESVDLDLPRLRFHDLRGSSSSYKLIISNGDIKTVQGDSGHASPDVLLRHYAAVQDSRRMNLAQTIEQDFYKGAEEKSGVNIPSGLSPEQLQELLTNNPSLIGVLVNALNAFNNGKEPLPT